MMSVPSVCGLEVTVSFRSASLANCLPATCFIIVCEVLCHPACTLFSLSHLDVESAVCSIYLSGGVTQLSVYGLSVTVICTAHISVVHVLGRPVRCLLSTSVLLLYRTLHQCNIFHDITHSAFTSMNRRGRCDKIHQQIRNTLHTSTFGNTSIRPDSFELGDPVPSVGCMTI